MSTTAPPKPGPQPEPDPNVLPPGPPEEEFWEKYNKRLEFPFSTVGAVLLHVLVGALVVFILVRMANSAPDKASVPIVLVDGDGLDDFGSGSPGGAGNSDLLAGGSEDPFKVDPDVLPNPTTLPDPKLDELPPVIPDPTVSGTPASPDFKKFDAPKDKKRGGNPGAGREPGKGGNTRGTGPGGDGADSTRARRNRWILSYLTRDAADYVNQLALTGAVIAVPIPNKDEYLLFTDLRDPSKQRTASLDDLGRLGSSLYFVQDPDDYTRPEEAAARRRCEETIAEVSVFLRLNFRPKRFIAVFPNSFTEELARLEKAYDNRLPETVARTKFEITFPGGRPEARVVWQVLVDGTRIQK